MKNKEELIKKLWPYGYTLKLEDDWWTIELYLANEDYFAGCALHKDADLVNLERFIQSALEEMS